jgi:hypothetical protein
MTDFVTPENFTGYRRELESREWFDSLPELPFTLRDVQKACGSGGHDYDPFDLFSFDRDDQYKQNGCVGLGSTNCLETLVRFATGKQPKLSRQMAYMGAQSRSFRNGKALLGVDQGAYGQGAIEFMTEVGLVEESFWPYPNPVAYPGKQDFINRMNSEAVKNAQHWKIRNAFRIKNIDDASAFTLSKAGCLLICMSWPPGMDANGLWTSYNPLLKSGHCVMSPFKTKLVLDRQGRPTFPIVNSHYATYGKKGFGFCSDSIMQKMIEDKTAFIAGITDLVSPGPDSRRFVDNPILGV